MLPFLLGEVPPPPPPPAIFALFELLKIIGLVLAFGIAQAWQNTFGALFKWMASLLDFSVLGRHPLRALAHQLDYAASRVQNFFGGLALAREPGFVTFLTWQGRVARSQADEIAASSTDTAATLKYQQEVFTPWFVGTKTAPLHKAIGSTSTTAKRAATSAKAAHTTATRAQTKANATAKTVAKAHVVTLPQTIAHVNGRVGALERWEKTAKRDLSRLKSLAKPLAFAGLVGAALSRLGLNWIRCPQNKRFGKNLCGRPDWFLNAVIGAFAFVAATEGLVPFAKQVQGVVTESADFAGRFWHANRIGGGGDRQLGSSTLG